MDHENKALSRAASLATRYDTCLGCLYPDPGFPHEERFGLTSQLRRAAVSIPSNIAEDHGRGSDGAFAFFLKQTKGSLFEIQTQLELSSKLELIQPDRIISLLSESEELAKMLNGLLRAIDVNQRSTDSTG